MAGSGIMQLGKYSKRKWLLVVVIFLCIFLLVSIILASIGIIGMNSQLVTIKTSSIPTSYVSNGYGINLDSIPVSNMVKDSSFELQTFSYVVKASDSSSQSIYFRSEDASWNGERADWLESKLVGSDIRVLTSSGNTFTFLESFEGKITGYSLAELGVLHEVEVSDEYINDEEIINLCIIDNSVVALTSEGKIISDLLSDLTSVADTGDYRFVDIIEASSGIAAASQDGEVFYSTDGRSFSKISSDFTISSAYMTEAALSNSEIRKPSVCGLVCSNKVITEVLDNGDMVLFDNGSYTILKSPYGIPVVMTSTDKITVIINEECDAYCSSNGVIYYRLDAIKTALIDVFSGDTPEEVVNSIASIDVVDDSVYILASNGKLLRFNIERIFNEGLDDLSADKPEESEDETLKISMERFDSLFGENLTIKSSDIVSSSEIIVSDMQGRAYLLNVNEDKVLYLTDDSSFIDNVFTLPDNKVVITSGDEIFESSVYMSFKVDTTIGDDAILPGDLCYIDIVSSKNDNPNIEAPWECFGEDTSLSYELSSAVGFGDTSAVLNGSGEGINILSQEIGINPSDYLAKDSFYRISLNMKQKGISDRPVNVWLSVITTDDKGVEQTVYQEGFTVDSVGGKFKKFDYVFAVTTDFTDEKYENASLRFNVAYEGSGKLNVDGIYVGLDKYAESSIINPVTDLITSGTPSIIRLNNLDLGEFGYSDTATYSMTNNSVYVNSEVKYPSCTSIEDSLRLVLECKAVPWLVIGSDADYDNISALMEYLCGSIGSSYGRLRIDNGTAIPWSRQFEKIYIEINDSNSRFESDIQRSSYVNFIMTAVQQPDFYNDIKDVVVFVDGMNYDGATVLSSADFHCGSLNVDAYDFYRMLNETDFSTYYDETSEEEPGTFNEVDAGNPSNNFILAINELYKDYGYSVPRHNQAAPGDGGEMISSLKLQNFDEVRKLTSAELLSFLMCEQATGFKSILLDIDVSGYSLSELEKVNSKKELLSFEYTKVAVIGNLAVTSYASELTTEFVEPLDKEAGDSSEEFIKYAYARSFYKDNKLYIIVFNTSDELVRFGLRSDEFIYENNSYARFSSESSFLYNRELGNRTEHYNLQPGEYMICEIDAAI